MKKLWLAMVIALLCFGNIAMAECTHVVWCYDATKTCVYCGEQNVEPGGWNHNAIQYENLGAQHQEKCNTCGTVWPASKHTVDCSMPTICYSCNAEVTDVAVDDMSHRFEWANMGDVHWRMCGDCGYGYGEPQPHIVYCDDPTTCSYCGATGIEIDEDEYNHRWKRMNLGTECQYVCTACGKTQEPGPHRAHCNSDVLTCYLCGVTGIEFDVEYMVHAYEYVDLGAEHQKVCKRCGYGSEPVAHSGYCTDPTTCRNCDMTGVKIAEENLHHRMKYVNVGSGHQFACINCGYSDEEPMPHSAYCNDPTTCSACGATGIEIAEDRIWHRIEAINMGETHQFKCTDCGVVEWEEEHFSYCNEPGVCAGCEIEGVTISRVSHRTEAIDVGKTHQFVCEDCGVVEWEEEHFSYCDAPDVCAGCEIEGVPISQMNHQDWGYRDIGTKHQEYCSTCDYEGAAEDHWANCNSTTTCYICEITGLTIPSNRHMHRGKFTNKGDTHSFACNYCDYTLEETHYVKCKDQSKCYQCGATGFEVTWENRYCTGKLEYLKRDASSHTFSCSDCKQTYTEPHEFDYYEDGSCHCGMTKGESTRLPGDADNSAGITLADAVAVLQYCATASTSINTSNADVTGDSKVDEQDALRIMQYDAGWNVKLQ